MASQLVPAIESQLVPAIESQLVPAIESQQTLQAFNELRCF
ncbi:hypothetical protein [Vibrio diabolicus]